MALMICPDCGNECSTSAVACPHCGRPISPPAVAPKVIVKEVPVEGSFPKWIFIPISILGAILIFALIVFLRNGDEPANRNINVRVANSSAGQTNTRNESREITTVPTIYPVETTTPISNTQIIQGNSVTVATPLPDKGVLTMEAKVLNRSGAQQAVTKETFYLLDKDLRSILYDADIEDPEGHGQVNSFGISVVNPSKYPEIKQKSLAEINKHIVYKTLTDGQGKAEIKDIKPNSYHLFGITRIRNGFAIWDSPVTIQPGQNNVVLEPLAPTEFEIEN